MGKSHMQAALDGTEEIGLAVLATTFTIVAVFIPVAFMGGIIGRFFLQFGVTVAAAVLLSLFVSFTLDPMLSSIWPDPHPDPGARKTLWQRVDRRWSTSRMDALHRAVRPRAGLGAAPAQDRAGAGAGVVPRQLPAGAADRLGIRSRGRPGRSAGQHQDAGRLVAATTRWPRRARPRPRCASSPKSTHLRDRQQRRGGGQEHRADLRRTWCRARSASAARQMLQKPHPRPAGRASAASRSSVGTPGGMGGGKPIQISLLGPDIVELGRIADELKAKMAGDPRAWSTSTPAWKRPSRRWPSTSTATWPATWASASSRSATRCARWSPAPRPAPGRRPTARATTCRCACRRTQRSSVADLQDIAHRQQRASNADGSPRLVPLQQVASFTPILGASRIDRKNLRREVLIGANASGRPAGDIGAEIDKLLPTIELPPGYSFSMGGSTKDMQETLGYAAAALALAVIFIYLILASQFKSFLQPIAIMSSLPLSLVGCVPGAAGHRQHAEHLLDHRLHHADGPGDEERDPAGRLRQPGGGRGQVAHRRAARSRPGAAAPDPDDHRGDDLRHAAAGARPGRRRRAARADGACGDRRPDHLDAADADRRAGDLHLHRTTRRLGAAAPARDPGRGGRRARPAAAH